MCMCVQVEGEAERELQSLHDAVYKQALVWVNSLKAEQRERIEGHFGPMPEKDSGLQVNKQKLVYFVFFSLLFKSWIELPHWFHKKPQRRGLSLRTCRDSVLSKAEPETKVYAIRNKSVGFSSFSGLQLEMFPDPTLMFVFVFYRPVPTDPRGVGGYSPFFLWRAEPNYRS